MDALSPEVEYELWRVAHRERNLLDAFNYVQGEAEFTDYVRLRMVENVDVKGKYL